MRFVRTKKSSPGHGTFSTQAAVAERAQQASLFPRVSPAHLGAASHCMQIYLLWLHVGNQFKIFKIL